MYEVRIDQITGFDDVLDSMHVIAQTASAICFAGIDICHCSGVNNHIGFMLRNDANYLLAAPNVHRHIGIALFLDEAVVAAGGGNQFNV
jgi:hypothetical protein